MAGKMKNVDIFVANRMRIIENLTASKSEIFHQNFVIAGGKIIKTLQLQGANSSKLCNCRGQIHQNFVIAGGKIHQNFVIAGGKIHQNFVTDSVVNRLPLEFVTRCSYSKFLLLFVGVLVS